MENTQNKAKPITTTMSLEDYQFFKDEQISPADVLKQHAQNLRGLLGIKYSEVIKLKDSKIAQLSAELSRICGILSECVPEEDFKRYMKGEK